MDKEQFLKIVDKVNDEVNLPIIGEKAERAIIFVLLTSLDFVVFAEFKMHLTDVFSVKRKFIDMDREEFKELISNKLNEYLDIPFISSKAEDKIFGIVVDIIFDFGGKGKTL